MKEAVTVVRLFKQFEALRVLMDVNIDDASFMLGVTPLAYKSWKNHGVEPKAGREPKIRTALTILEKRHSSSSPQS